MKEKELRPIVDLWLQRQGYQVGHELLLSGYCDVVGFLFDKRTSRYIPCLLKVIAVELKVSDVAGVISQAECNRYFVDKSFAAMPAERCQSMGQKTLSKFKKSKVGLLAVGDAVEIIVPARRMQGNYLQCDKDYCEKLRRKLWRVSRQQASASRAE